MCCAVVYPTFCIDVVWYSELAKTEAGRAHAIATFKKHAKSYHSIAAKMVARDLNVEL